MSTNEIKTGDWDITVETLNQRQEEHFKSQIESFKEWMLDRGKDPQKEEPLVESTTENYISRIKTLFKHVWQEKGYTTTLTHEHAKYFARAFNEDRIKKGNDNEYAGSTKRKYINTIEKYIQWRAAERGGDEWECPFSFEENSENQPDIFNKNERRRLREEALTYKSVPKYNDLSPEARDRWKGHIAQVRGKPKENVTPDDWEYLNTNYKWVSLIWTALDAGLRPCEIERSKLSWICESNNTLKIPKDEAAKNRDNWRIALRNETVNFLKKWKKQRENIPKYDTSDAIWLNRKGNPYNSGNLNYHLRNLLQEIGLEDDSRDLSWYSIRHSTGTYLEEELGLAGTAAQLRHKSIQSTERYVHPPPETRREALMEIT